MSVRAAVKTRTTNAPSLTTSGVLQRKCAGCGNHTMAGDECQECANKRQFGLQTKLKVNEPGDVYEQEADRIADQVLSSSAHPAVSRTLASIRRFAGRPAGQADAAPASVEQALASPGRPLEPALRQDMEQRFGHDFSRVRVHSGAAAAQSAQDVNAHAYTMGHDVVFGAGQYAPQTGQGRRLLAHELAHVVQQRNPSSSSVRMQRQPTPPGPAVRLATEGQCRDARAIAEAIPGARSMAEAAFNWFLSFNSRDRARIGLLLRANFLSDSADVRDTVKDRILSIGHHLAAAQAGSITFVCAPTTDTECAGREGYVLSNERNRIHICDPFFNLTLEGRRWMLIHESAHLAGAMKLPESYHTTFGPMGEQECRELTPSSSTREALGHADNYARLVWCLTRAPGIVITPATP